MKDVKGIVKKSNFFVRAARYKLSIGAQYLLNESLVARVAPGDDDFERYEFTVNELCAVLGYKKESYYRKFQRLKAILRELQRNIIEVRATHPRHGGEILLMMSWIESPMFDYERGVVSLRLSEQLRPFLLVDKNFAAYRPTRFTGAGKTYAFRIFEYCVSHRARAGYHNYVKGGRYVKIERFSINDFRARLGIPENKYTPRSRIRSRILKPALKIINEQTDERFEFKMVKDGRLVVGVELHIYGEKVKGARKRGKPLPNDSIVETPSLNDFNDSVLADRMFALGVGDLDRKNIFENYKPDAIRNALEVVEEYKRILSRRKETLKYPGLALRKALKKKWISKRVEERMAEEADLKEKMMAAEISKAIAEDKKVKTRRKNNKLKEMGKRLEKEYQDQEIAQANDYDALSDVNEKVKYVVFLIRSEFGDAGFDKWSSLYLVVREYVKAGLDFADVKNNSVGVVIRHSLPSRVDLPAGKNAAALK